MTSSRGGLCCGVRCIQQSQARLLRGKPFQGFQWLQLPCCLLRSRVTQVWNAICSGSGSQ